MWFTVEIYLQLEQSADKRGDKQNGVKKTSIQNEFIFVVYVSFNLDYLYHLFDNWKGG